VCPLRCLRLRSALRCSPENEKPSVQCPCTCSNHYDEALISPIGHLLTSITSLQALTLSQFDLSDDLARHLSQHPHLTRLSVGRCGLTRASMPTVLGIPSDLSQVRWRTTPLSCCLRMLKEAVELRSWNGRGSPSAVCAYLSCAPRPFRCPWTRTASPDPPQSMRPRPRQGRPSRASCCPLCAT